MIIPAISHWHNLGNFFAIKRIHKKAAFFMTVNQQSRVVNGSVM